MPKDSAMVVSVERLLDNLPLSVYVKNPDHKFIYVNKATVAALGARTRNDVIGKSDYDFFIDTLADFWEQQEDDALAGHSLTDFVEQEVLKDGKSLPHWVLTCKYRYLDENGKPVGVVGISKQIDKEHEELVRNRQAVRGAQVGLWHIKYYPDGQKESWFSPRWKELLGYADHEIRNRREEFENRVHPEDFPKVIEARARYAANPKKEGHYECEFRMKHKSKGWIWIRSYGEAEFSPDGRTCTVFAGSHSEITSYKDEHELHEEILSMLSALVFMKDENKHFIFVNPELARYYGTTKDKMEAERERDSYYNANKEQTDGFEADDAKVLANTDPEIREKGLVIDAEEIINRITGKISILKTTKKLFMYPSRNPRKNVLGISTDITDALKKTNDERDRLVEAHMRSRKFLAFVSSVQDLFDFRTKLPEALKQVNLAYGCIASGVLTNARPGENNEHVMQAYTTQTKSDFLKLRLARVQGKLRAGVINILNDQLLSGLTGNPPPNATTKPLSSLIPTPFGHVIKLLFPKVPPLNSTVILAAGVSHGVGPKRLSDLICFFILPTSLESKDSNVEPLLYFAQRFTESLAQYYRNSELYAERKAFLTDVTHQLVTPLVNTIDICSSAVDKLPKLSVDQITDRFYEARGLVRHCAMFTRAFLAASQSDEAELVTARELNETSVKVTRLMIEVGKDFRVSAETKGLTIVTEEDVLDSIGFQEIDEEKVRHAIMNVVDNAVKYTAARTSGRINLFGEQQRAMFALCVRNPSSIPIHPEHKERIFDRWFRSPEAEEEEVQGTGIGLALAHAVVIAHGGRIDVEQKALRNGAYETVFRLWFPSSRPLI